jgi:hypothetical protein
MQTVSPEQHAPIISSQYKLRKHEGLKMKKLAGINTEQCMHLCERHQSITVQTASYRLQCREANAEFIQLNS